MTQRREVNGYHEQIGRLSFRFFLLFCGLEARADLLLCVEFAYYITLHIITCHLADAFIQSDLQ